MQGYQRLFSKFSSLRIAYSKTLHFESAFSFDKQYEPYPNLDFAFHEKLTDICIKDLKALFHIGDKKFYDKLVGRQDIAEFDSGTVHNVYATFALGRDAEWCSRLFVLEMKDEDEEGIGTFLHITHRSPALINEKVVFEAEISMIEKNSIECNVTASVGNRIIAYCRTGQKIIKKEKLDLLFESLAQT